MTIFDHFETIRIVNLPQRRDRRRAMARELARVGLAGDPRVAFLTQSALGCRRFHLDRGARRL